MPLAIAGSTNDGIFWKIGGGGMNGILVRYLQSNGANALENANQKLNDEKPKNTK